MMGLNQASVSKPSRTRRKTVRANGFILIPVLWVLGFLALITAILTRTVSTDIKASANLLARAQSEVLSDGLARLAIRYAVATPMESGKIGAFPLNGTPLSCSAADSIATISIASTAGLVDLNTATADTLERLFTAIGAPNPAGLAAAVIDFRDPDDEPLPGGAERAEYQAAGLAHTPKNAPFTVVGELDQVLGMTPDLFARARPLVTVSSRLLSPDVTVAGPDILAMAFPNDLANLGRTRYIRVTASVRHANNPRQYTREAVMLVESRLRGGFKIKDWDRIPYHIGPTTRTVDPSTFPSCFETLLAVK